MCPLGEGELGPRLTQCGLDLFGPVYLHTKWHLDLSSRLATINMVRNVGAVPLFSSGRCWVPV